MEPKTESALDVLWKEYSIVFGGFDDATLARWMAQTLGQLRGQVWRMSHPLVCSYRLAAQVGLERQIWLKRLVAIPAGYVESSCCRAPMMPLLTRDILESGLMCQHCGETLVEFSDLPASLQPPIKSWAEKYDPWHQVSHWDEQRRRRVANYEEACEEAALAIEKLYAQAHREFFPLFLEYYPILIWEDQDECLDVQPEDIKLDRLRT